jgi:hypothetical protein
MTITTNSGIVARALERGGPRAQLAVHRVVIDYGYRAIALIRRHASGRPGPNVITGDYRRSWVLRILFGGSVVAGTNSPQARRLEEGFFDTDSAGRTYRQRAYPHVAPAAREIRIPFQRAVMDAAVKAVRG